MKFDPKEFMKVKFVPGTGEVKVPDMASYFTGLKDKEIPVWKVRGLDGVEYGQCELAAERNKKISAGLDGLVGGTSKAIIAGVKEAVGLSGDVPQHIAKRIALLVAGSVEPEVDQETAVRINKAFPIETIQITNKIVELTGHGHVPGKPKVSGKGKT